MFSRDFLSADDNRYDYIPVVHVKHFAHIHENPSYTSPLHVHNDALEISFIISNSCTLMVDQKTCIISAGDIAVVQPGYLHGFLSDPENPVDFYTISIAQPDAENKELHDFFAHCGCFVMFSMTNQDFIKKAFEQLHLMFRQNGYRSTALVQTLVTTLAIMIRKTFLYELPESLESTKDPAHDILLYIAEHYAEEISLKALSEHFCISVTHLSRLFTGSYYMSPINYLIDFRMFKARNYLYETNLSITAISQKVGYKNVNHFTNLFVKRIGCMPSEYRKRNKDLPENKPFDFK